MVTLTPRIHGTGTDDTNLQNLNAPRVRVGEDQMPQLESRVSAGIVTGGSDAVIANRARGGARLLRPRIANLAYALRDTGI